MRGDRQGVDDLALVGGGGALGAMARYGLLRDRLGPNASVIKDPEPDGGVLASFGDRRVDATLTRLAALELAGMPEQLVTLWG